MGRIGVSVLCSGSERFFLLLARFVPFNWGMRAEMNRVHARALVVVLFLQLGCARSALAADASQPQASAYAELGSSAAIDASSCKAKGGVWSQPALGSVKP